MSNQHKKAVKAAPAKTDLPLADNLPAAIATPVVNVAVAPAVAAEAPAATQEAATAEVPPAVVPAATPEVVAKAKPVRQAAASKSPAVKTKAPVAAPPKVSTVTKEKGKGAKPAAVESKPVKAKKIKLVRDSYAMPETEYAQIGALKKRLLALGAEVKKSELLRGGIAALAGLGDAELKAMMAGVERIKTGRPAKK